MSIVSNITKLAPNSIAIIGAGVVGIACARALAMTGKYSDIIIIEKDSLFGSGASSRNSEVCMYVLEHLEQCDSSPFV